MGPRIDAAPPVAVTLIFDEASRSLPGADTLPSFCKGATAKTVPIAHHSSLLWAWFPVFRADRALRTGPGSSPSCRDRD
jgi:hypothetical protein